MNLKWLLRSTNAGRKSETVEGISASNDVAGVVVEDNVG